MYRILLHRRGRPQTELGHDLEKADVLRLFFILHNAVHVANDPVPLYPYPSSPDYRRLWGAPDGQAWERAHAHYLAQFDRFSDIQDGRPLALDELEASCRPV